MRFKQNKQILFLTLALLSVQSVGSLGHAADVPQIPNACDITAGGGKRPVKVIHDGPDSDTPIAVLPANPGARIEFKYDIDMQPGQSWFNFLRRTIYPAIDDVAKNGFKIVDADTAIQNLHSLDKKVQRDAIQAFGSENQLRQLMQALNGKTVTLTDMEEVIKDSGVRLSSPPWKIGTFLSLISGGGVAVRFDDSNYCYNCGYNPQDKVKGPQTGRTYVGSEPQVAGGSRFDGTIPARANDASDVKLLTDLQNIGESSEDPAKFSMALMKMLLATDPSGFRELNAPSQLALAEVMGVGGIAEGARHLMTDLKSFAWDIAVYEVTMLSVFHSGQSKFALIFQDKMTTTTLKQERGGMARSEMQAASMKDYWQFSSNPGPNAGRSGINETKSKSFRPLGRKISDYMRANHPEVVARVEAQFAGAKWVHRDGNIYQELTSYLVNFDSPETIPKADEFAQALTDFLVITHNEADAITKSIMDAQGGDSKPTPIPASAAPAVGKTSGSRTGRRPPAGGWRGRAPKSDSKAS